MGTLSVDRLGPVSCGVFPPYISLGLAHLTCSMIGLESGDLDIPRQGQNPELFVVFLEPFQVFARVLVPQGMCLDCNSV